MAQWVKYNHHDVAPIFVKEAMHKLFYDTGYKLSYKMKP